ncbi:unnamed protein product [Symbiodinium pilosum]|uniref:Uncharacterized protein n=1 Tax=Symbiodinium pilosum TaxID=2952 RepID=A0A812LD37_SYMPI|nr:unnamed protein product [Symbiodinium pilosum]
MAAVIVTPGAPSAPLPQPTAALPPWSLPVPPTDFCCFCLPMLGGTLCCGILVLIGAGYYAVMGFVALGLGALIGAVFLMVMAFLATVQGMGAILGSRGQARWARYAAFATLGLMPIAILNILADRRVAMMPKLLGICMNMAIQLYTIYVFLSLEYFVLKNEAQARELNINV